VSEEKYRRTEGRARTPRRRRGLGIRAIPYHRMAYQVIVGGLVSAESGLREKIPTTPWAEYARYALPHDGVPDYCWARSTGRKRSARETPNYGISNQCCEKDRCHGRGATSTREHRRLGARHLPGGPFLRTTRRFRAPLTSFFLLPEDVQPVYESLSRTCNTKDRLLASGRQRPRAALAVALPTKDSEDRNDSRLWRDDLSL
jgi:hypothetical protein